LFVKFTKTWVQMVKIPWFLG